MKHLGDTFDYFDSFLAGEERGFSHYFRVNYKPLLNFAMQFLGDINLAEDVLQDSFIRLFEKRDSIASEGGIKPYLYSSVKNNCINKLRRLKHFRSYLEYVKNSHDQFSTDVIGRIIATEVMIELKSAVDKLPAKYQHLVTEVYFSGRKVREIARDAGLSQTTVKSRKGKALKMLRKDLS
jgi:RNA polymerase sigma-70 factor (ECF subfamily)